MSEKEDAQGSEDDHAGVRFPPPFIILSFLVAGIMADSPWVTGSLATLPAMVMGGLVFALGAVLAKSSVPRHRKAGSNVEPWKLQKLFLTGFTVAPAIPSIWPWSLAILVSPLRPAVSLPLSP